MRDLRYEQLLTSLGATWVYQEKIKLTKVDKKKSQENQARLKPIEPKHVEEMALGLCDGKEFPALIAFYGTKGLLVLMDGNHRYEAYTQLGIDSTDFYIVEYPTEYLIEVITRGVNCLEGVLPPVDDRLRNAVYLRQTQQMTLQQLSRLFKLAEGTIENAVRGVEVGQRLVELGFNGAGELPVSTRGALYRIKQDATLLETALLVRDAKLTGEETAQVVRKLVKVSGSERSQAEVLKEQREKLQYRIDRTKKPKTTPLAKVISFRRGINIICQSRPHEIVPELDADLRRKTRSADDKLREILNAKTG